jgi:GNAT superfamily N-acetyltransferase
MTDDARLVIQPLDTRHDRAGFRCGVAALDTYLARQARQDVKRRISRVFVAASETQPSTILGYYTLSSLAIELDVLPPHLARRLPRHPVPAALLGRLAVSQAAQGQGIGSMLLADAVKRTLSVSNEIAIYALVVDAVDESAQRFYERFGFTLLGREGRRLFLPLKSV